MLISIFLFFILYGILFMTINIIILKDVINMYNFIKVKIYNEKEHIGNIHFFNNDDLKNKLKKELLYFEKEYGNISYEITK